MSREHKADFGSAIEKGIRNSATGPERVIGLGIDAGGTYTDAVIYDLTGMKLLSKKKALTTPWDFTEGIKEALSGFSRDLIRSVNLVALSTTLATNAIVESRGQKVGLLFMPPYGIFEPGDSITFQAKQYPPGLLGRFPLLVMTIPYLFPIESYVAAPFARWLPRNAFGARIVAHLLGYISVLLSLLILARWRKLKEVWPVVLLVLIPSSFQLVLESAYARPGYSAFLVLTGASILLTLTHSKASGWRAIAAAFGAAGDLLITAN